MKLQEQFTSQGFDFTQIQRTANHAIYEKTRNGESHFETIRIQIAKKDQTIKFKKKDGSVNEMFVPKGKESYPSSSQWGIEGFTLIDRESAQSKLNKMEQAFAQKEESKA